MSARAPFDLDDVPLPPRSGVVLRLTSASAIAPQKVNWLWSEGGTSGLVPDGALTLIGGREGIGKSLLALDVIAKLTHGRLPGTRWGRPSHCLVSAVEDSWAHVIVPRLMAAGADLGRVHRVDAHTVIDGDGSALEVPRDVGELERVIQDTDAALVVLDPLMSRLSSSLDTHRDGNVRQGLEPLVSLADRTGCAVIGLIHVNKSGSDDALNTLMGSRAFPAVARSVLYVAVHPDDDTRRICGQVKNNLGEKQGDLAYTIEGRQVREVPPIWAGRVVWGGASDTSIQDALRAGAGTATERATGNEAADWLRDYLEHEGGSAAKVDILKAARATGGYSEAALQRARIRLKVTVQTLGTISAGVPRRTTVWRLPVMSDGLEPETTETTETTGTTAAKQGVLKGQRGVNSQSCQPAGVLGTTDTTGANGFAFDANPTGSALDDEVIQ